MTRKNEKERYVVDDDAVDKEDEEEEDMEDDQATEYPEDMVGRSTLEAAPTLDSVATPKAAQTPVPIPQPPVVEPKPEPKPDVSFEDKRVGLEKTPSIWDEGDVIDEQKKRAVEIERERKKMEEQVYNSLKKDAGEDVDEDEDGAPPTTGLTAEEIENALRFYVREEKPSTPAEMKRIARRMGVDFRKVFAVVNEMQEEKISSQEKAEREMKEARLNNMQQNPPNVLTQPLVPGVGHINPQNPSELTNQFIAYLLSQQQRAEDRALQDRRELETRNNQLMIQMFELLSKKQSTPFSLDGDLGQRLMAKMVSNLFNPTPIATQQQDGALATALKGMVETGQFGQIVSSALDFGQAALTKGKGGAGYDLSIPQQQQAATPMTATTPTTAPAPVATAQPQPQVWTAKRFVEVIRSKDATVPEDVATVAAEVVTTDPQTATADPKTQFKWIVAIIRGTEQLKNAAIGLHQYLIKQGKTPKQAADFVRKSMPDVATQLRDYDYDSAMRELERFRKCASLKKYIDFFYHPEVAPKVKAFFDELKNPTPEAKVEAPLEDMDISDIGLDDKKDEVGDV